MSLRYLFGPVTANFADQNLRRQRERGECLAFDQAGATDLPIGPDDSWESLCAKLPAGWKPDFIVLQMQYATMPECLWKAPVPFVGLAMDWNLQWHYSRNALRRCELVFSDPLGVEVLSKEGISSVRCANLFGCERAFVQSVTEEQDRPIDILFVGNLTHAVQRERLPWMQRLARLAQSRRVVIRMGVFGDDYRKLLGQARIVFNRSIRGECNLRVFEALSAGALLFQEAGNRAVPNFLREGQDYVSYTPGNLEQLLEYYLTYEDERRAIAESGRWRAAEGTFESLWDGIVGRIEIELTGLRSARKDRPSLDQVDALVHRTWQALSSSQGTDPSLLVDLETALQQRPNDPAIHNALGLIIVLANRSSGQTPAAAVKRAAWHFQQAVAVAPGHAVAGLNLAEALVTLGKDAQAAETARRVLSVLDGHDRLDAAALDAGHFPPNFDYFRVEWERAALGNAGDPAGEARAKTDLLRWRLHTLLAQITGELQHYYEAVVARSDLPVTRAALGCALARAGRPDEALPHLRRSVSDNPFDFNAARALYQALGDSRNTESQRRFAAERSLLAAAAPGLVPVERWFQDALALPLAPTSSQQKRRLRIVWEGPQLVVNSFGLLNREICLRLIERGHEVSLASSGFEDLDAKEIPAPLARRLNQPLSGPADIHVGAQWPPRFERPASGRLVLLQPWEFGAIPTSWLEPLRDQVDELWAPSRFVRDCFVQAGVPADRVHVVPLGVGTAPFHPGAAPLPLKTRRRFKFLFVGGTIRRKGIDVLLDAYSDAFTGADDVCLVIKDMGVGTFYRGQTAEERIARHQAQSGAAEIEYVDAKLRPEELAGLYTACDCLVHPYRGEGFGLPIAEAMACGLPVIVTGYGAALDFCNEENAYLVAADIARFPEKRIGDLETADYPWLAEPRPEEIRNLLRHVVEHPEEAEAKGKVASRHIREHFTWDRTADAIEQRLAELCSQPVRRSVPSEATAAKRRQRVSLCMIVKNEEENIAACLQSVTGVVDEMIVVDTGSSDRTKEIAAELGARVFDFPWPDSFSVARNESIRHATGDWVFWLDADDRVDEANRAKLRELFARLPHENVGYSMKCVCLPDTPGGAATIVDHVRLFRNRPDIRWEYRVHEQILPAIRRSGGETREADITIQHTGYQDTGWRQTKDHRNLRLLELDHADDPNNPFTLFNLGWTYEEMKRPAEALPLLKRSLELSMPSDSIVRKLYSLIMECHRQLGQPPEALEACLQGRRYYPNDAQLLFQEAILRREQGDRSGAEQCLLQLISTQEAPHFASVVEGLRGHKARHNLAVIYHEQGRNSEAEAQWQAAVREEPRFAPAWLGLGELYLSQGRLNELERVLGCLEGLETGGMAGPIVLRARLHMARSNFADARELLEQACTRYPSDLLCHVLLSHALLRQGTDFDTAERVLRRILELDENNNEARNNLAVLLHKRAAEESVPALAGAAVPDGAE